MTHQSLVRVSARLVSLALASLLVLPALAQTSAAEEKKPEEKPETPAAKSEAPSKAAPAAGEAKLSPEAEKAMREQIRGELTAEMQKELDKQKEEMRAEIRAAVAASAAAEEWQPEQFQAEKPKQPFFEVDGYFRVRPQAFVNFDLNTGLDPEGKPLFPRPGWDPDTSDTLAGVNQRLRVQPVLNVSEDIKIKGMVDVLDNIVWGQTPSSWPLDRDTQSEPLLAFNETTVQPMSGLNAALDSVSVKRLWAEVTLPVGVLRFGRQPSNWGLGLFQNDGNCLDCDYGDTWDRFMFVARVGSSDYYIVPAVDLSVTGPIFRQTDTYQWQPFDLEQRDDVDQYVLILAKRDNPEDVEKQVQDGLAVFNFGLYNVLRVQAISTTDYAIYNDAELTHSDFVDRDALMYIPDLWMRLNVGKLRLELEAAAVFGRIGNGVLDSNPAGDNEVTMTQFGGALQSEYKLVEDKLHLGLELGYASGDSAPGMGSLSSSAYPLAGSVNGRQYDVGPGSANDHTIDNFKFNPDYHVDLILWRQIFRRITDAMYAKPSLSYDLTPSFGFDLSAIYSRAVFAQSTPGDANDLGIELDGALRYHSSDGFILAVEYGILFPLGGLKISDDPQIAQTVQGFFGVQY